VGYTAPISTFTGRVLDSQATNDIQQPLRTLRAGKIVLSPDGRRLYMLVGGLVAAWDTSTFFTRLASGESLMTSTSFPLSTPIGRAGAPEVILRPDRFFYAEWGSPWTCPYTDGQTRLNDFDVDDQGYVYLSHYVFGWGIVKDDLRTDGSLQLMDSQYQHFPYGDAGDQDPIHILSFKTATDYYALINVENQTEVWRVTDRRNPVRVVVYPATRMNFSQAAKNAAGNRIAIMDGSSGAIVVYTADALAAGGNPIASIAPTFPYQFASVTSDGTNFFGAFTQPTLKVSVITPSGSTFVQSSVYDTGISDNGAAIRASGGYLSVILPSGMLLFKISASLGFTPVVLKSSQGGSYFAQYYFNFAPPGYGFPHFYVHAADVGVIKQGNKSYLMFNGGGLADVYELQTADGINIAQLGSTGTQNSNTPPTERVKTFYGDPIGFTASTTAPAPMSINWNFGNAEAVSGADANTAPPPAGAGQTGSFIMTHRYSGIGTAASLTPRTVTVTNTLDSSIFATTAVTMQPPLGRIGIVGFSDCTIVPARNCFDQNFVQVGATQPLPIVAGDKWFDASDGSLEGHNDSWNIAPGTPPPLAGPSQAQDVGPCGTSSLTFGAHYGQNGTLLPATDYTAPAHGLSVLYGVKPFAAYVTIGAAPGTTVTFTNATRFGSSAILPPAIKAALVYKWELINGAGGTVAGPTGDFATTATWVVPKTTITHGMVARLTVTSATDFAAPCAGFTSSQYSTAPLNPPDPVISITGGTCATSPCTFTVASASGIDTVAAGWTYSWSVTNTGLFGAGQTFIANFPNSGQYTVSVQATNNVGNTTVSTSPLQVTVQVCLDYRPNIDVFIVYSAASGCSESPLSPPCQLNETIQFRAATVSYNLACAPHTYSWDFGDGTPQVTGQNVTHAFTSGTTHSVTCAVTDTSSAANNHTLSQNVTTQTITHIDNCAPGMNSNNVSMAYATNSGSCSNAASGSACGVGETISFSAAGFPYNFGCGQHSFTWNFGDNTTGSGQITTHAYAAKGTYTVTVYIVGPDNPGVGFPLTSSVTVGTVTNGLGCNPAMKANQTVFINYADSDATCTDSNGGTCRANEQIQFTAGAFPYSFTCAVHQFAWDFGDGHTGTGSTIAHSYAAGTYTVSLTISNPDPNQTVHMTKTVTVGTILTTQPPTSVDFSVTPWTANGVVIPNGYIFTPESVPATAVTSWIWDFGDNTCPGAGAAACTTTGYGTINHLFPNGANYSITLIGKNSAGQATTVHLLLQAPPHRRSASH
jgi:PKD repeat protein